MNTSTYLFDNCIQLADKSNTPQVELVITDETIFRSYLFSYFSTGNVHYLKEARKINNFIVDSMSYVFMRYEILGSHF